MTQRIELKIGNVLEKLKKIESDSVDCICTSPPYYGLRKYKAPDVVFGGEPNCEHEWVVGDHKYRSGGIKSANTGNDKIGASHLNYFSNSCSKCSAWKGQLGLEPDYRMYLNHMLKVTAELKRVLKPTGTLWWNMGDTYAGSCSGNGDTGLFNNSRRHRTADMMYSIPKPQRNSDIPSKSLMQLPTRLSIRMADEQGWILRNNLIWLKKSSMPSSVKDRLSNRYENVYFFVKQKRYFFNLDAVRVPTISNSWKPFNMRVRDVSKGKMKSDQYRATEKEIEEYKTKQYKTKYLPEKTGQSLQGFTRNQTILKDRIQSYNDAKALFPNDTKAQKEYIKNVHDHNTPNPLGKNPGDTLCIEESQDFMPLSIEEHSISLSIECFADLKDFISIKINEFEDISSTVEARFAKSDSTSVTETLGNFIHQYFRATPVQPNLRIVAGDPYATITIKYSSNKISIEFGRNRWIFFSSRLPASNAELSEVRSHSFAINAKRVSAPFLILMNWVSGIELPSDIVNKFNVFGSKTNGGTSSSTHDTTIGNNKSENITRSTVQFSEVSLIKEMLSVALHDVNIAIRNKSIIMSPTQPPPGSRLFADSALHPIIINLYDKIYKGNTTGDVLELSTTPFKGAHFAVFPPKLPEFCIKAGCPKGGIVLDPFAGSGTTMQVARELGMSAISIELSEEYAQIIKKRLNWGAGFEDIEWKVD